MNRINTQTCEWNLFVDNLFTFSFIRHNKNVGIIRKAFEDMGKYNYILTTSEMTLLHGMIELLDIFNVFTVYVQGDQYPTMNTMALFYTEIEDRLEKIRLFNTIETIENAATILLEKLPERFELKNEHIAAALIDPRMQHLSIVNKWISDHGIVCIHFNSIIFHHYNYLI